MRDVHRRRRVERAEGQPAASDVYMLAALVLNEIHALTSHIYNREPVARKEASATNQRTPSAPPQGRFYLPTRTHHDRVVYRATRQDTFGSLRGCTARRQRGASGAAWTAHVSCCALYVVYGGPFTVAECPAAL
jgi:hypothetical protein